MIYYFDVFLICKFAAIMRERQGVAVGGGRVGDWGVLTNRVTHSKVGTRVGTHAQTILVQFGLV